MGQLSQSAILLLLHLSLVVSVSPWVTVNGRPEFRYDSGLVRVDLCIDYNRDFYYRFTPRLGEIRPATIQDYFIIWMLPISDRDLAVRYGELRPSTSTSTITNQLAPGSRGKVPVLSFKNPTTNHYSVMKENVWVRTTLSLDIQPGYGVTALYMVLRPNPPTKLLYFDIPDYQMRSLQRIDWRQHVPPGVNVAQLDSTMLERRLIKSQDVYWRSLSQPLIKKGIVSTC